MSRKPETTFANAVHKHGRKDMVYIEKMHNPYRGGTFDYWYSGRVGRKLDAWIEFKYMAVPRRDSTMMVPNLSPLQQLWGRERFNEDKRVFVVLGSPIGGVLFDTPDKWEAGLLTGQFRMQRLDRKSLMTQIMNLVT